MNIQMIKDGTIKEGEKLFDADGEVFIVEKVFYPYALSLSKLGKTYAETLISSYFTEAEFFGQLKDCIAKRGLQHIFHFTSFDNLVSILDDGLLSRAKLERQQALYYRNDDERYDGLLDYINCSLEYPNNRLLATYEINTGKDFVLIDIDISILLVQTAKCSFTNAAKNRGKGIMPIASLEKIFDGKRSSNLADNHPTDEQAEILIRDVILPKYFKALIFKSKQSYIKALERNITIPNGLEIRIAPELFETRKQKTRGML